MKIYDAWFGNEEIRNCSYIASSLFHLLDVDLLSIQTPARVEYMGIRLHSSISSTQFNNFHCKVIAKNYVLKCKLNNMKRK